MLDDPSSSDIGYVGFDGDRIGDRIIRALIENDEVSLISFAKSVANAIAHVQRRLEDNHYRVLLVTGDGHIAYGRCDAVLFRKLAIEFNKFTGATLSVGFGNDLRNCYLALKFAKSLGGGNVVRMQDYTTCPL